MDQQTFRLVNIDTLTLGLRLTSTSSSVSQPIECGGCSLVKPSCQFRGFAHVFYHVMALGHTNILNLRICVFVPPVLKKKKKDKTC